MNEALKEVLMNLSEELLEQRADFAEVINHLDAGPVKDAITAIGVSIEKARLELLMLIETGPVNGASVH